MEYSVGMKRLLPLLLLVFSVGVGAASIEYKGGGDMVNGVPHGHGTVTWVEGIIEHVGEWQDGKKHGQGAFTWPDGDRYVGEFKGDVPWEGALYDKDGNVTVTYSEGVGKLAN